MCPLKFLHTVLILFSKLQAITLFRPITSGFYTFGFPHDGFTIFQTMMQLVLPTKGIFKQIGNFSETLVLNKVLSKILRFLRLKIAFLLFWVKTFFR